ncbi:hypothetical protein DFH07DRAFT_778864 [Mycena maculata]|uniref:Uncharacterized protein n=1 Tax=Mycena maculata TaxID=230809 RepID=A0AAD7IB20_9AGAR|nr:hypothetical protein DFH07DRAFT_778864 [Mycena maculata]
MDCFKLDSSEFQANWNQMLYQVSATFSMLLLYTLYTVLFTFSVYTVIRQNPAGRRFFLVTSSLMFLLGTCDVIVSVLLVRITIKVNKAQVQNSPDLPHLLQLYNTFFIVDAILMVANNCNKCAFDVPNRHEARSEVGGETFYPQHDTVIAMILESGSIYVLAIIVGVVAQSIIYKFPNSGPESVRLRNSPTSGVWSQIVNIAPTLILVRIGFGHCPWIQDSTQSHGIGPGPMTFRQNSNITSRSIGNPVHTVDFGAIMEMNISNSTAFTGSK